MRKTDKGGMMEKRRSVGVTIFACLLIALYGFTVLCCLFGFFASIIYPEAILSILKNGGPYSIKAFHLSILWQLLIYIPGLIGAIATLRLKEWGRKLLLILHTALFFYLLYIMATSPSYLDIAKGMSFILYVSLIYFFTRPNVKEQFR